MGRARIVKIALSGLGLGLMGCASDPARYVYQDHESGVIAIPRNTPKMMAHAQTLMEKHFPGKNYDVVRTVEVDTGGSRATYEADKTTAEASPSLSRQLLIVTKLTREGDRRQAESMKVAECRVVYRRRDANVRPGLEFTSAPEYMPKFYTDAVAENVLGAAKKATEVANASPAKTKDGAIIPTAGTIEPLTFPKSGGK